MRATHKLRAIALLFALLLTSIHPVLVHAQPGAPNVVPDRVGNAPELRDVCHGVSQYGFLFDLLTQIRLFFQAESCDDAVDHIDAAFDSAYLRAEDEVTSPGFPTNDIHSWQGVLIQDFSGGAWDEGFGAIIAPASFEPLEGGPQEPAYVGGAIWSGYLSSVFDADISPGYPINLEYPMNDLIVQDFRGGDWVDGTIIGRPGAAAFLVAGRHLQAYQLADGFNRLGIPLGNVVKTEDGLFQQDFEGGILSEHAGVVEVTFFDTGEVVSYDIGM